MKFEWDVKKNKENIRKHGISFEYASQIFLENKYIEQYDKEHSTDTEDRWNAIGKIDDVLYVVYTIKEEDTYRIISARLANKEEINEYYRIIHS